MDNLGLSYMIIFKYKNISEQDFDTQNATMLEANVKIMPEVFVLFCMCALSNN